MSEDPELTALRGGAALRTSATLVGANVLLAVLLIGIPFRRGRTRAEETTRALPVFAACLFQVPSGGAGLALPPGERERIATLFVGAAADWPAGCSPALHALQREPAVFLWPDVKTAELEVDAAVVAMEQALADTAQARARTAPIPEHVLQRFGVLRAAVANLRAVARLDTDAEALLVEFPTNAVRSVMPSRIPTTAVGELVLESEVDRLTVTTLDAMSFTVASYDRAARRVEPTQHRRPAGLRALVGRGETPLLVWFSLPDECRAARARRGLAEDEDGMHPCRSRATGVARLGAEEPAVESWLSGHPAIGSRSFVQRGEGIGFFVAGSPVEWREFAIPAEPSETPRAPSSQHLLDGFVDGDPSGLHALWIRHRGAVTEVLAVDAARGASVVGVAPFAADTVFGCLGHAAVLGAGRAWLRRDSGAETEQPLVLSRPARGGTAWDDGVRVVCDAQQIAVIADGDDGLAGWRLGPDGVTPIAWDFAPASFDAHITDGQLWIAASADRSAVVRLQRDGTDFGVVAACWNSGRGLCGPPRFARGGGPVSLATRDGTWVSVVEWSGTAFTALSGLPGER